MAELGKILEGKYVYLRDVREEDLPEIIRIRTDPVLSKYIHPINPDLEFQRDWLRNQKKREGDYYFSIVRISNNQLIGTVGIYNISFELLECEVGRLISEGKPLENLESLNLCYEYAFNVLKLKKIHAYVVQENEKVVNLHKKLGYDFVANIQKGIYSDIFNVSHFVLDLEQYNGYTKSTLKELLSLEK